MEPTCFDAEGSATLLPSRLWVERQRVLGKTEESIDAELANRFGRGAFHAPKKPGIVYMMSSHVWIFVPPLKQTIEVGPHLMFYAPYATDKDLGNPPEADNMPRLIRSGRVDAMMIVFPAQHEDGH